MARGIGRAQKTIKALIAKETARTTTTRYRWDLGTVLVGGVGIALMLAGDIPTLYWPGVVLVYFGALLLLIHLASDHTLRSIFRAFSVVCITAALWSLSNKVVFVDLPLDEDAYAHIGNYPPGMPVSGIQWDSGNYADLRLDLTNSSNYPYKDIDILLTSDMTIWAASQTTEIPGVLLRRDSDRSVTPTHAYVYGTDASGKPFAIPGQTELMDYSKGYRLICEKLSRRSTISLVLAVVVLNHPAKPPGPLFAMKRLPVWLKTAGEYTALGRQRRTTKTFTFPDGAEAVRGFERFTP